MRIDFFPPLICIKLDFRLQFRKLQSPSKGDNEEVKNRRKRKGQTHTIQTDLDCYRSVLNGRQIGKRRWMNFKKKEKRGRENGEGREREGGGAGRERGRERRWR